MAPSTALDRGSMPGRPGEAGEGLSLPRAHRDVLAWGVWGWLGRVLWALAETHEVLPPLSTFFLRL